jgi:CubicO group peptidase (beta-lactamase class C family)
MELTMRHPRVRLVAALLLLSWTAALPAQAPAVADRDAEAVARARALVASWVAASGGPASQISVSRDGRILWSEAFGYANLELKIPATPRTRFRIGSVSKPLTAAAIGRLVEDGRLDLDAPVQRYVPDFPEKPWPITARQLAGHLAGIRHYKPGEFVSQRHYDSVRASLAVFENDPLLFEPGTRFAYSSYGWNLLSAVVEGASGQPFLEFMQKRVFEPAGMADTSADDPGPIVPNRASFYTRDKEDGPIRNALYVDNSVKWAGGGFLSTTDDLLRFANGLMAGTLLTPQTVTLLWSSQRTADGKETGYGIGFDNEPDAAGRRRVFHSGSAQGGTAILILYPDERLAIAMAGNTDYAFTGRARELVRLFLEGEGLGRWESREAGFAFTVPPVWAARVRASFRTGKEAQALHPKAVAAVPFRYTQYGNVDAPPILTILIFSSQEWRAMAKAKTIPPGGEVLANRGGRTWVAVPLEKNPYVPGSPDFEAFEEIRVDAAAVRKAFALRPGS